MRSITTDACRCSRRFFEQEGRGLKLLCSQTGLPAYVRSKSPKSSILNENMCAGVRWSAQECAGMCWSGYEDFQSYSPGRVSARNCLMWNTMLPTASCAGVCWNTQECAGVGHNLGTIPSGARRMISSREEGANSGYPASCLERLPVLQITAAKSEPASELRFFRLIQSPLRPRPAPTGPITSNSMVAGGSCRVHAEDRTGPTPQRHCSASTSATDESSEH